MENGSASRGKAGGGESSLEFRLLMAYTQRRRPRTEPQPARDAPAPAPGGPRGKRKRTCKMWKVLLMCVRPQKEREEEPTGKTVDVNSVADRLSRIVDSVEIKPDDIETDNPNDDVIQQIVDLLRESGDDLNQKVHENKALARQFGPGFTYTLFERITSRFLLEVAPSSGPDLSQAKVALACEVTRRLTAVDSHPMNMVMGFGAKYLRENFSSWVQLRGGWENAFDDKEDEEIE